MGDSSGNLVVGCKLFVLVGLTHSQKLRFDATVDGYASQQPTRMGIDNNVGSSTISPQPCWMVHVVAASVECLRHLW